MVQKGAPLSPRELEIAELVATGATNLQIARKLSISSNTVKTHLANIFVKLEVQSRTELAMRAVEGGWVDAGQRVERLERGVPLVNWTLVGLFGLALTLIFLLALRQVRAPAMETGTSPLETDRWSDLALMPTARSRLAVVAHEGLIYAIGGQTVRGVTGLLEIYDPTVDSWHRGASKPTPVEDISAVALRGKIYVPGGCTGAGEPLPIVEVYDPRSDGWEAAAPLPEPLCGYALASLEGRVYLFGGWDGGSYSAAVYRYDPDADTWQAGTPLPSPRGYSAAATLGSTIYLVGGYDGERRLSALEVYDPVLEGEGKPPWRSGAPMSVGRAGLGMTALGGSLYVIGGGWDQPIGYNEWYDPQEDTWTRFESPLSEPWRQGGVAAIDTRLYLIGGWNGDYLDENRAYQALFRIFIPVAPSSGD